MRYGTKKIRVLNVSDLKYLIKKTYSWIYTGKLCAWNR